MDHSRIRHIEQLLANPDFRAWCVGDGTPENDRYWDQWVAQNEYRRRVGRIAKRIVLDLEQSRISISPDKKHRQWQKIARRINRESSSPSGQTSKPPRRKAYHGWVYTAAAVIVLLLISFITIRATDFLSSGATSDQVALKPSFKTISTDYGESKVIQLDSGTKITLNANSSIRYLDGWVYRDEVNVQLMGEAYFDVVKRNSESAPVFRVETSDGSISVLGTRFVVSTREQKTKVVLEEGRVSISQKAMAENVILHPSHLAEFSSHSTDVSISQVNTELYTSWVKGFFVFDHESVLAVAHRIEQTFGIEVQLANPSLFFKQVSGSIEAQDVDMVVSALAKTLQVQVSRDGSTVLLGNPLFQSDLYNQSVNLNGQSND